MRHHIHLQNQKFDILISNVCLCETPLSYLEYIGEFILPNCKNVFIIGGGYNNPQFYFWIIERLNNLYNKVIIKPSNYKYCVLGIGKEKK